MKFRGGTNTEVTILILQFAICMSCRERNTENDVVQNRRIEFAAYRWSLEDSLTNGHFYIDYYLKADLNGNAQVMKRNEFKGEPKFYSVKVEDSVLSLINDLWFDSVRKTEYGPKEPIIYDGPTYRIDFVSNNSVTHSIDYLTRYAPTNIQRLNKQLGRIVNWATKEIPPFQTETFRVRLAKTVSTPPPPPPDLPPPVYNGVR